MKKVLVTYATNAGTTKEVAQTIGEEMQKNGLQVDILPLESVSSLEDYRAVVLGGPMIMGWHRGAVGFLKKRQAELKNLPVALFFTAMSLTNTGESAVEGVPVFVDERLAQAPQNEGRLTFRERYATVPNYLRPVLKAAPAVKPVGAAFFGGRLDLFNLKWWQALFVMLIIQAKPGERRNWDAIRAWANNLAVQLGSRT